MPMPHETAVRVGAMGGRPRGLAPETKKKIAKKKAFDARVVKATDKLLDAQLVPALGSYKMVKISFDEDNKQKVTVVREEKEMQDLLDNGQVGVDYLLVVGAMPDYKAINAILDRTYGKARETIEVEHNVQFSLKGLAERRIAAEKITEASYTVLEGPTTQPAPDETP